MISNSTVVLGAGLAGLSTAYHLKGNYSIYEQDSSVGGLCKSINRDGFTFDYTGHLLHTDNEYVDCLIRRLLNGNISTHNRNAWIYSKGVFTRYPFQTNLYGLPPEVVKECLLGLVKAQYEPKDEPVTNFEDWIYRNFGEGIARHFMIPYNWKLFTVHPKELNCEWIKGFIPPAQLEDAIEGALSDSERRAGYHARFYYPQRGGIEELCKAFADYLPNIKLNKKAIKIDPRQRLVIFEDGEIKQYSSLVSSLPLPELIQIIDKPPQEVQQASKLLRHNSVLAICLGVSQLHLTDKHWIYFPEEDFVFYRVNFPMNLSSNMAPCGKSSICAEVSYSDTRTVERSTIIQRAIDDLIKANILRADSEICLAFQLDIKYAYVIYDRYYQGSVSLIHNYLRKNNIHSIGRYGAWEYSTMAQAILEGKHTAIELQRHEEN